MTSIFLPNELLNIIFNFICDTQSYLNARVVCKKWYCHLHDGKIFKNNKLIKKVIFMDEYIKYLDVNDKLVADVVFKKYGHYVYRDYNYFREIITSKPFKLMKKKDSHVLKEKIEYNIVTDKKSVSRQQMPMCAVM